MWIDFNISCIWSIKDKLLYSWFNNQNFFFGWPSNSWRTVPCFKRNQIGLQYLFQHSQFNWPFLCGHHVCCRWCTLGKASHWSQTGPRQHKRKSRGKRRNTSPPSTAHWPPWSYRCCEEGYSSSISETKKHLYFIHFKNRVFSRSQVHFFQIWS